MRPNIVNKETFIAFQSGDENAFQVIMWNNFTSVQNYIFKIVKSNLDAEELTQDVFLKLWQNHASVDTHDKFRSYLFSIAHNVTMSYLRKTAPQTVEIDEQIIYSEFVSNIDDRFDAQELMFIVSMVVATMPERQKAVFKMSRIEGLSIDEIAQRLSLSRSTVKSHLNAALNSLREVLLVFICMMSQMVEK